MRRRRWIMLGSAALVLAGRPRTVQAEDPAWDAARHGRAAVLMRHAVAPGGGDPPGFRLDDCSTQRGLSAAGRAQSRAIGEMLRARGIPSAHVLSSAWCRCLDTAERLGLGPVTVEPILNSFFADRSTAEAQTAALRGLLRDWSKPHPLVLVSHQVNITALTGVFPASGEALLVYTGARAGALALRVPPPAA
ncbi:MAG: histidine phosphatase family protein [Acetobacteraceae bacterium]